MIKLFPNIIAEEFISITKSHDLCFFKHLINLPPKLFYTMSNKCTIRNFCLSSVDVFLFKSIILSVLRDLYILNYHLLGFDICKKTKTKTIKLLQLILFFTHLKSVKNSNDWRLVRTQGHYTCVPDQYVNVLLDKCIFNALRCFLSICCM